MSVVSGSAWLHSEAKHDVEEQELAEGHDGLHHPCRRWQEGSGDSSPSEFPAAPFGSWFSLCMISFSAVVAFSLTSLLALQCL